MTQKKLLIEKLQESINSILPITAIVAAVSFLFVPIPSGLMLAFLLGAVHMILGMGMFSVGAELSMSRIGGHSGAAITTSRKLWVILLTSFALGTAITLAEPECRCARCCLSATRWYSRSRSFWIRTCCPSPLTRAASPRGR